MKRIFSVLLAALLICLCFSAPAESTGSFEEYVCSITNVINFQMNQYYGFEMLFNNIQEVVPDEIYGFFSEDADLQLLYVANLQTQTADSCSIISDTPGDLPLALNVACVLPMVRYFLSDSMEVPPSLYDEVMALANWFDSISSDVHSALTNGEATGFLFTESTEFHVELLTTPTDEGSRMLVTHYFRPASET